MSANCEWQIPFTIRSTLGDLDLNDDSSSALYLLIQEGCSMTSEIRATVDDIPQASGRINHKRFTSGYEVTLEIAFWEDRETPACDDAAQSMLETLMRHLNLMLNDTGRVLWTPSGTLAAGTERMLDEARVLSRTEVTFGPAGDPRITVVFDSPFPYVIDAYQTVVALADGATVPITNFGTADFYPVVRVDGPTSAFWLENTTTNEQIVYDETLPGAVPIGSGDYLELDFFRNTAYLNGAGNSRKSGVDIEASDFWVLQAGILNNIELTGASGDLLLNHAFA